MKIKLVSIFICAILIAIVIPVTGYEKVILNSKDLDIKENGNNEIYPTLNDRWLKTFDFNEYEAGFSVQQTSDGGYIIVGGKSPPAGDYNLLVIKTDNNGDIVWTKEFENGFGFSVKQTSDGGYVIGGEAYSSDNVDIWLIKTDNDGNIIWDKKFDENDSDYSYDADQTSDGGYIVVGLTGEPGDADAIIIKTDGFGNSEWIKTYGGTGENAAYSVVQTPDGGYVVSGTVSTEEVNGDVWLFKINGTGELLWENTYGESYLGNAYSVQLTNDEGFIITGVKTSTNTDTSALYFDGHIPIFGNNDYDIFLIKTDESGEVIWEKTFGGEDENWGIETQQTNDNGYIIIGFDDRTFGANCILIKTNSNGETQWTKTYCRKLFRNAIAVSGHQTSDGGYILTGYQATKDRDVLLIKTDSNGNVPRSRVRNIRTFSSFERFLNLFPILKLLIQRIILYY